MEWEHIVAALTGVGLAAACGFRVFVPPLLAGIAFRCGWLDAPASLAWMGGTPALVALGLATLAEVAAYKIPWLDHALDVVASPVAVVAGLLLASGFLAEADSWLVWTLGAIAAVGAAGAVQAGTVATRVASTATTGGLANPLVALLELVLAAAASLAAILLPIFALLALSVAGVCVAVWLWRRGRRPAL